MARGKNNEDKAIIADNISSIFALNRMGRTKNSSSINSRSGNKTANAAISPNPPADAPTTGPPKRPGQSERRQHLKNSADHPAAQIQSQEFFPPECFFNGAAKDINRPAVDHQM